MIWSLKFNLKLNPPNRLLLCQAVEMTAWKVINTLNYVNTYHKPKEMCIYLFIYVHAGTGIYRERPLTCETKSRFIIEAFMKRKVLKIMKMRVLD